MSILQDLSRITKYLKKKNRKRQQILIFLEKEGWEELGIGAFKIAYGKGKLVAKVLWNKEVGDLEGRNEIELEKKQYEATRNTELEKKMAKIYYADKKIIIQERVSECKIGGCREILKLARKYRIFDYWHNHGHKKEKLKIFDYIGLERDLLKTTSKK